MEKEEIWILACFATAYPNTETSKEEVVMTMKLQMLTKENLIELDSLIEAIGDSIWHKVFIFRTWGIWQSHLRTEKWKKLLHCQEFLWTSYHFLSNRYEWKEELYDGSYRLCASLTNHKNIIHVIKAEGASLYKLRREHLYGDGILTINIKSRRQKHL